MENVFSILLLLACPIGMGLVMWLMMRGNQQQATGSAPMPAGQAAAAPAAATALAEPVARFQAPPNEAQPNQTAVGAEGASLPTENRLAKPGRPLQQQGHRGLCFNWKVLAGLAVVGLAILVVAPNVAWAALPLLLLAACPISMLLMMRGMQGGQCSSQPRPVSQPTSAGLTADEQLAALKTQLADIQVQHETIARAIAELEAARRAAPQEAEAVAQAGAREQDRV